jgi:hypothetical protein
MKLKCEHKTPMMRKNNHGISEEANNIKNQVKNHKV